VVPETKGRFPDFILSARFSSGFLQIQAKAIHMVNDIYESGWLFPADQCEEQ